MFIATHSRYRREKFIFTNLHSLNRETLTLSIFGAVRGCHPCTSWVKGRGKLNIRLTGADGLEDDLLIIYLAMDQYLYIPFLGG